MKKKHSFLVILSIPVILLIYSYSAGSSGGYSGSPIDDKNCANCHISPTTPILVDDWLTSNIPQEGYTPGITYTLTATGIHDGVVKFGFELTAEDSIGKVGTFEVTDINRTHLTTADAAVTHTLGGTTPTGNTNTWSVDWTAPADGVGDIIFYAAFNAANGNDENTGDRIYITSQQYPEFHAGIGDNKLKAKIKLYPNPASTFINVDLPDKSELKIINMIGQEVINRKNTSASERINLSHLSSGVYFVQVSNNNNMATIRLLKK